MKIILLLSVLIGSASYADDTSCSGALIDDNSAQTARLRHAAGDEEIALEGVVMIPGDTLTTGSDSTIDLSLCDGSQIRVGPNSEYFLDQTNDTSAVTELLRGSVRARVTPSTTPSDTVRFQVRTPTGVIGVRGTEFIVEENDGESQLFTLEGEVLYGGEDMINEMRKPFTEIQNRVTLVKKGEQSRIARGTRIPVRPQAFQRSQLEKRPVFRRAFQAKPADLFQRQRQTIRARVQERMKKPTNSRPTERAKPTRLTPQRREPLQPRKTERSPLKSPKTGLEKSKVFSKTRMNPMRPTTDKPMNLGRMQKKRAQTKTRPPRVPPKKAPPHPQAPLEKKKR